MAAKNDPTAVAGACEADVAGHSDSSLEAGTKRLILLADAAAGMLLAPRRAPLLLLLLDLVRCDDHDGSEAAARAWTSLQLDPLPPLLLLLLLGAVNCAAARPIAAVDKGP